MVNQVKKKLLVIWRRYAGRSGFTLVELLVAMSIFGIFMAVIMGAFVQVLANERVTLKLLEATDNLGVAIEQMSREIRVGNGFSGGSSLSFERPDSSGATTSVMYALSGGQIIRTEGSDSAPLTSSAVHVTSFDAVLTTNSSGGIDRPTKVKLIIGIAAEDRGLRIVRYVQTSVTQRVF
ncbi:MAG: type II secretion system protein [Candidatus Paceibacterota bacterium]|jgi:prepilin-type N-terminal cleavage/methylation domain-containing protein